MKRTKVIVGIVAAVSALILAGCSGNSGGSGGENVQLTFLNAHPKTFDTAIAAYEKAHPNVTIKQQSVPFNNLNSQIQSRLGSQDTSVDVIAVDSPRLSYMVSRNFLADVSSDKKAISKAVSPQDLSTVTIDGKIWSYPQNTSDGELLYNKAALAAAGAPEPKPGEVLTWEQVLSIGAKAQQAGAAKYGLTIYQVDRYYQLQPILMSMGASSGLKGAGNLTPEVNSPKWKAFGDWYSQLYKSGLSPRGIPSEQITPIFANGQSAFYLASSGQVAEIHKGSVKDGFGVTAFPYFESGKKATPADAWTMGVSKFSKHQDAARDFAKFITINKTGAALGSTEPGSNSFAPSAVAAVPAWQKVLSENSSPGLADQLVTIFKAGQKYAVHRPQSVGYVQFETVMNDAFSDIRNGSDPDQVLDKAQSRLQRQRD